MRPTLPFNGRTVLPLALLARLAAGGALAAQEPAGDPLTNDGVVRASAIVDSVFVDRHLPEAVVAAGDFASYLMARLGVIPIPDDLRFLVLVDSQRIRLNGRIQDLPQEARLELGPLIKVFPPETMLNAFIVLTTAGSRAIRFHLQSVTVNGFPIPEVALQAVLYDVGKSYPALTKTGRDLYVEIPPTAQVILSQGAVRLVGPHPGDAGSP